MPRPGKGLKASLNQSSTLAPARLNQMIHPLKAKPKTNSQNRSVLAKILTECLWIIPMLLICNHFHKQEKQRGGFREYQWTARIGSTVIFSERVCDLTPVQTVIWDGDYFTRTQKCVLTNVRSVRMYPCYRQQPKDMLGWVW